MPAADRKRGVWIDPFHPAVLFLVFYLVYFVFSGMLIWLQHDYVSLWVNTGAQPAYVVNTVFFLGIVSVAAFSLGVRARISFPGGDVRRFLYRGEAPRLREMRYVICLFLVLGAGFTIYHLSLFGPLSTEILRYLSPSAQRDLEISLSQAFVIMESMLNWAALLAAFYYIVRYIETGRKDGRAITLLFLVVVILIVYVTSGKRSAVIPLLLLPLIWHHYLVKRLDVATAGVYFAIGIATVSILLLGRIVVPLLVQDLDPTEYLGIGFLEPLKFYFDTGELSTFDMVVASLVKRDELLSDMGGAVWGFLKYSFGTLIILIPRAIWADKPDYQDPGHVYYRLLTGENADIGFAVTAWGTSFLFFHIAGILFGMLLFGWICRGIYTLLRPWEGRPFDVFFYAIFYWMAFQFLRFGTVGFTFLLFITSMFMGVLAGLFLARRKRKAISFA